MQYNWPFPFRNSTLIALQLSLSLSLSAYIFVHSIVTQNYIADNTVLLLDYNHQERRNQVQRKKENYTKHVIFIWSAAQSIFSWRICEFCFFFFIQGVLNEICNLFLIAETWIRNRIQEKKMKQKQEIKKTPKSHSIQMLWCTIRCISQKKRNMHRKYIKIILNTWIRNDLR